MVLWRLSLGVTLLVIMKIITVLLCAFANLVTSQANDRPVSSLPQPDSDADIFPARMLVQQKTLSENSDLYLTCSIFGSMTDAMVYFYICKDGLVIKKERRKSNPDSTLTIHKVGLNYSGSYSCVYSIKDYSFSRVAKRGFNIIQIVVIDISLAGPSTVHEGDDVKLRCTVSGTLQTFDECQFICSYLMRNESILQVQAFNVMRREATFTIKGAVTRDSGDYSCMVLPSKCIQEHEKTLYGNNTVLLRVKESLFFRAILCCEAITMMLLLLCLWWINKRALCNPCAVSPQTNTVMLEEQQEQPEGEDLEALDEDSFSMEEEEVCHNAVDTEDPYSDDCEGVYSVADETGKDYDDVITCVPTDKF